MNIALVKDYLREEGLDATAQPHAFGKPALLSVINGKADIATVGDTPIVFAVMGGKKITVLAVIQTSNRNEAIVARRDKGIAKPSDLKGKKSALHWEQRGIFLRMLFCWSMVSIERVSNSLISSPTKWPMLSTRERWMLSPHGILP